MFCIDFQNLTQNYFFDQIVMPKSDCCALKLQWHYTVIVIGKYVFMMLFSDNYFAKSNRLVEFAYYYSLDQI